MSLLPWNGFLSSNYIISKAGEIQDLGLLGIKDPVIDISGSFDEETTNLDWLERLIEDRTGRGRRMRK